MHIDALFMLHQLVVETFTRLQGGREGKGKMDREEQVNECTQVQISIWTVTYYMYMYMYVRTSIGYITR